MDHVNACLLGVCVRIYLDDLIVFTRDQGDPQKNVALHFQQLAMVFNRLRAASLKLKRKKCDFLQTTVKFLGHELTTEGVKPLKDTVDAIVQFNQPRTVKQVRAFLGMAGFYRKFVKGFSSIASPLYEATTKQKLEWTPECQVAFQSLKVILTSDPILVFPDFTATFKLETDACDYGIGAVLTQLRAENWKPVAFFSKHLSKSQVNYSVIQKEALAIVLAVRHFRVYLYGKQFVIYTDHRPLKWMLTMKEPSALISRWLIELSEYSYTVEYKAGSQNNVADGLSRIPDALNVLEDDDDELQVPTINALILEARPAAQPANEQLQDPELAQCLDWLKD